MKQSSDSHWRWTGGYFLFCLPVFFYVYRLLAFEVIPADSYYLFVQYWADDLSEFQPTAPTAYRLVYLWSALPFYEYLPLLTFSKLPAGAELSPLRAKQALSILSYLSTGALLALTHYRVVTRLKHSHVVGFSVSILVFFFLQFMAIFGVDPFALAYLSLILAGRPRSVGTILAIGFSFLINEKIPLLLVAYFFPYWTKWKVPAAFTAALAALVGYVLLRHLVPLPGYTNQLDLANYGAQLLAALPYLYSLKGIYLNIFPVALLCWIARPRTWNRLSARPFFVLGLLYALGLCINLQYTIGSRSLYALPLFVPALARWAAATFGSDGGVTNSSHESKLSN